jgi:SAM-dependent methyltransferase
VNDVGSTKSSATPDACVRLVGAGYDTMADTWEAWVAQVSDDPRRAWLESLLALLPPNAAVVELGCGNGTYETRELARRAQVTGVDLSEEQLRRARERVPEATFVQGDLTTIDFEQRSLDAVVALYVLNHVPRELLAGVFARIHRWVKPGGHVLATLGAGDIQGWQGEWLGVPMFFSSYPPATNSALLRKAGFALLCDEVVTIAEPEGAVAFQWVLGRR